MENSTIPFFILIITVVITRLLGERALKRLTTQEKGMLLESFSGYRISNLIVSLGLVIMYFVAADYIWPASALLALVFIILFFAMSSVISFLSYRKLKALNMPASYNKGYIVRLGIQYAGLAAIFLPIAWKALATMR
ncbi:hypothetical protein BH10ACI2_BH10ACI2_13990 [soil metagenome]